MPETGTRTSKSPPSRRRLNELFVKTAKPDAKRKLYWDTIQQGLVLCVEQTGHKSYKLIYTFNGRARWYTIGNASKVGLKEARDIARKRMGEVYSGLDVQAERQAVRQASTFEQLAGRYVEEHAKRRNKSWRQADFLVRTYLLPRWRNIQASAITRGDARSIFDRLTQEGSPVLANQILAAASAIFSWAMKNDVGNIAVNPCGGIERNSTSSRERVLSDRELPLFWRAFEEAGLMRCNALRMILLTGQRPGEVRHMRWEHVEDGWWTMPGEPAGGWPGTKNKQTHRVWLSPPVGTILDELRNGAGPGRVRWRARAPDFPAGHGYAIDMRGAEDERKGYASRSPPHAWNYRHQPWLHPRPDEPAPEPQGRRDRQRLRQALLCRREPPNPGGCREADYEFAGESVTFL